MSQCLREKSYILMRCDIYVQHVEKSSHPWITRNKCVITLELKLKASAPRLADETYCCG